MSYGQKPNNAWSRQVSQITPGPNAFTSQFGITATQPFAGMPALNALVNQAAFSNMNVLAQARPLLSQQVATAQQQRPTMQTEKNQRTFVGTVTKLMETYGFVDDDVFFQTNVIRGALPRVGDRVMVEAAYNASMPFKWNAFRIQLIQQQQQQQQQHQHQDTIAPKQSVHVSNGSSASRWERQTRDEPRYPISDRHKGIQNRRSPSRIESQARRVSPIIRQRSRTPSRRSPVKRLSPLRKTEAVGIKRTISDRDKSPIVRDKARTRSPTSSKRDADSPPRRRQRIIPRYSCALPKAILPRNEMKYLDIHKRYNNLYIPSDFFKCEMSWTKSIRLEDPPRFSPHPITFNILHKDVDIPVSENEALPLENPPDADSRFIVKVLLLSHPGISSLRQKIFGLLSDGSIDESADLQPLAKTLHLLVGCRGKELMGIGGAWSPSLDGLNPIDPQTIINTATRTTYALTGIDLSSCSRWYKMLHFRYFRVERSRVDSVVLLLPDTSVTSIFSISPEQYQQTRERIMKQLSEKLAAIDAEEFIIESKDQNKDSTVADASLSTGCDSKKVSDGEAGQLHQITESQSANLPEEHVEQQDISNDRPLDGQAIRGDTEKTQEKSPTTEQKTKTHWSKLNVKAMKVVELREELELRSLDSKGVKNVLSQRLQDVLDKEKSEDPNPVFEEPVDESQSKEQEPKDEQPPLLIKIKEELVELMETDEAVEDKDENADELIEKPDDTNTEQLEKERKELEKAKEKFEKEKKEKKAALERHYKVPEEPCVLVYPSKTAKSGKFECRSCSLSSLLEYRQEDNREHSFEVFLFAEALKESIDRSNAFVIYHCLTTALDKETEAKVRDEALIAALSDERNKDDDEIQILNGDTSNEPKDGKDKSPKEEKPKEDPRKNYKALVSDMEKFTAFAHFDTNICGYLNDRDIEEILHSLGLDLSRLDVQRLMKKLSSRDRVNYRNLTDKWVDKDGDVKYAPSSTNDLESKMELLKGHLDHSGSSDGQSTSQVLEGSPTPDITNTGIVFYRGSVLNIQQIQQQHSALEKERTDILLKNEQLEIQMKSIKDQRDQLDKKKRRLDDDVDRYKKKLHSTEKSLKSRQQEVSDMKVALQDCKRFGERLIGVVDKLFPPPPPKKEEKEVIVLVETDEANTKKIGSPSEQQSKKPLRASSCPRFSE